MVPAVQSNRVSSLSGLKKDQSEGKGAKECEGELA